MSISYSPTEQLITYLDSDGIKTFNIATGRSDPVIVKTATTPSNIPGGSSTSTWSIPGTSQSVSAYYLLGPRSIDPRYLIFAASNGEVPILHVIDRPQQTISRIPLRSLIWNANRSMMVGPGGIFDDALGSRAVELVDPAQPQRKTILWQANKDERLMAPRAWSSDDLKVSVVKYVEQDASPYHEVGLFDLSTKQVTWIDTFNATANPSNQIFGNGMLYWSRIDDQGTLTLYEYDPSAGNKREISNMPMPLSRLELITADDQRIIALAYYQGGSANESNLLRVDRQSGAQHLILSNLPASTTILSVSGY